MREQPLSLTVDLEIRATFQAQLAEARETAALSGLVTLPAPDLYPRYSGYYRQLCRLPRRFRRSLQRQWKRPLSALALLLALGQAPALAATINVDGTNCTLAEAIGSANTNTAVGGCSKGSGADRLVLGPKSTHTLTTVEDTTYGDTGLPLVASTITIAGHGSTIERGAAAPNFRLLAVSPAGKLKLEKLALRGGYGGGVLNSGGNLTLTDCIISGNTTAEHIHGGGVSNNFGALTLLTNSTVSGNTAGASGGGVYNFGTLILRNSTVAGNTAGGVGGGVSMQGGGALTTIRNSTVSGNTAQNGGGGVANNGGTINLTNSTIADNTVTYGDGGGVRNDDGSTITLEDSIVSGNKARIAGGIANRGTLTVTNGTVSGNTTSYYGGGVFNVGSYATLTLTNSTVSGNTAYGSSFNSSGGGVYNIQGTVSLRNTTVSGNKARNDGGGVYNVRGPLTLSNSTVAGNTAGDRGGGVHNGVDIFTNSSILTLNRSLVSGNTAASGPEIANGGTVAANNFNLFGHNGNAGVEGFSPGPTDVIPTVSLNRILAPLAANGGPTRTRALVRGSPAIDAVRARCPPPATDQRGLPRPVDGDRDSKKRCDIGAFEFEPRGVCASIPPSKGCTVNGVPDQLCRGTADDDTIVGTSRNDVILGRRGSDVLSGLAGHDLLCGQQDNDIIRGGAGEDDIEGNEAEDELFGGLGNDWVKGGRGNDDLDGGSGKDRLDGQQGTDTCVNGESIRSCP